MKIKAGILYACDKCQVVWSRRSGQGNARNKIPDYYHDFPRYGKPLVTCPNCDITGRT